MSETSWENVGLWYQNLVGEQGHYYHQNIILPGVMRLLEIKDIKQEHALLDLACGQGVLARQLPPHVQYTGVDISSTLINYAKKNAQRHHTFIQGDASKKIHLPAEHFTRAIIILALQNIEHPQNVIKNAALHLRKGGTFIIVLNHPCFRIARQSSWGVDEAKKLQYRRLERYMSPMNIPIQMQPSKGQTSRETMSFHHPLSDYFKWLKESNFVVDGFEEWISDKKSTGPKAKMENRAREEFPLFLAIRAIKV